MVALSLVAIVVVVDFVPPLWIVFEGLVGFELGGRCERLLVAEVQGLRRRVLQLGCRARVQDWAACGGVVAMTDPVSPTEKREWAKEKGAIFVGKL